MRMRGAARRGGRSTGSEAVREEPSSEGRGGRLGLCPQLVHLDLHCCCGCGDCAGRAGGGRGAVRGGEGGEPRGHREQGDMARVAQGPTRARGLPAISCDRHKVGQGVAGGGRGFIESPRVPAARGRRDRRRQDGEMDPPRADGVGHDWGRCAAVHAGICRTRRPRGRSAGVGFRRRSVAGAMRVRCCDAPSDPERPCFAAAWSAGSTRES